MKILQIYVLKLARDFKYQLGSSLKGSLDPAVQSGNNLTKLDKSHCSGALVG